MHYLKQIREVLDDNSLKHKGKLKAIREIVGTSRGPYNVEGKTTADLKGYMRSRYAMLRAAGKCTQCAESKARPGKSMCSVCSKRQRTLAKARYYNGKTSKRMGEESQLRA